MPRRRLPSELPAPLPPGEDKQSFAPTAPATDLAPTLAPPVLTVQDVADIMTNMLKGMQQLFMETLAFQQQQFLATITAATAAQEQPPIPPVEALVPIETDISKLMKRFQKLKPPAFTGIEQNALQPVYWVEGIEKAFSVIGCTDRHKLIFAGYMLQGEAYAWWRSTKPILEAEHPNPTWAQFKEAFFGNYFPESFRDKKEAEFMGLAQGPRSVLEYQQKFEELYYFAPEHMRTDALKAKKFLKGLRPSLGAILIAHRLWAYAEVVETAKLVEDKQQEGYVAQRGNLGKRPMPFQDQRGQYKALKGQYQSPALIQYQQTEARQRAPAPRPMGTAPLASADKRCLIFQQPKHMSRVYPQRRLTKTLQTQPPRPQQSLPIASPSQSSQCYKPQGRISVITEQDAETTPGFVTDVDVGTLDPMASSYSTADYDYDYNWSEPTYEGHDVDCACQWCSYGG